MFRSMGITLRNNTFGPLSISSGSIEALKWLGLFLMVIDHVNKFIFAGHYVWMFAAGRVVMPIFGFVLAYNFCRPDALQRGTFKRTSKRLFLYGCVATVPYVAIGGSNEYGWPLNILFTLLVSTLVIWMLELRNPKLMVVILPVFSLGSLFPEYWHLGTAAVIASWYFCKHPGIRSLLIWFVSLLTLYVINGNFYALLAIPIIYAAAIFKFTIPRNPRLFYIAYPAHLAAIWAFQRYV